MTYCCKNNKNHNKFNINKKVCVEVLGNDPKNVCGGVLQIECGECKKNISASNLKKKHQKTEEESPKKFFLITINRIFIIEKESLT
jgi:hypothetical protein